MKSPLFNESIKKLKSIKAKPVLKKLKPAENEVWLRYYKNRIRRSGKDINYHQIAKLILTGHTIKVTCVLTNTDLTERVVLSTMNTYMANKVGNLDKYLNIIKGIE